MAVVIAAFAADQISGDGESHGFEGVQLLALYLILAILFFFFPVECKQTNHFWESSGRSKVFSMGS